MREEEEVVVLEPVTLIRAGHFRSDLDVTTGELRALLRLAACVKKNKQYYRHDLATKLLAWVTEKDSLRTTCTFQAGIKELGGDCILPPAGRLGEREAVRDVASNLGQWVQVIAARTFKQSTINELAIHSGVPVINALSDQFHPCQALADLQTMMEVFNDLRGRVCTFVGDGNNVCTSLMLDTVRLGMKFCWVGPERYQPDASIVGQARDLAAQHGGEVELSQDTAAAIPGSHVVYTDTWVSMGNEAETEQRHADFYSYQVNEALFSKAAPDAVFMHCMPAHRGQEVTNGVIDSCRSMVRQQAANRLHAQKALLLMLLSGKLDID